MGVVRLGVKYGVRRNMPFQKGHPGGPGRGNKNPVQKSGPSQMLKDMRAVYSQEHTRDEGQGQKTWRKVLDKDPKSFTDQLTRLEAAFQTASRKESSSGSSPNQPLEEDVGAEKTGELIGRLLKEIGDEPSPTG